MRFFGFILSLIVLSQLAPASQGALIAYESFTGTAGATLNGTAGGSGWTNAWSSVVPTQVTFVNQSLSYSAGQVTINGGTSALQIAGSGDLFGNREFANQTGTVYFSFLFQTSTSAGLTDDFAQFGLDTTNVNPRTSLGHTSTSGTDATGAGATSTDTGTRRSRRAPRAARG